ncbi:MAG: ABC transporter substrate-binding protein [Gemmatimonadaceae bacterium]|nr:ABC transporter substrate-binding protein [Gemmatimonadaceae bacterium]MCC6432943.1 ABC transporter substrate-binding protein [Gemmatimonadaceae bacterium]
MCCVTALSGVACREQRNARPASSVMAIGVGALPGRPGYDNVVRGVQMAVDRLNETGKMRFEMRLPDKSSTSAVAVAESLREDPSVIAVVGHPESGHTIEAVPVYADAEHAGRNAVVAISPTASSPRLSGISPWFFRVAPSDNEAARYVARWVLDSLKSRRAAVIYRNDSYGRDWSTTFADSFIKAGASVVSRDPYLAGMTEWDAYAQLLARLKPDVLLFPGDADDAVELLRALREAKVSLTFIGGDGTEGMRDTDVAAGAHYVAFFQPDHVSSDDGKTFVRKYTEKFSREPDMFAAMSYDAAWVIGKTVSRGATTRASLRKALEQLGSKGSPSVDGVAGPIAFERNHDVAGRHVVIATVRAKGSAF